MIGTLHAQTPNGKNVRIFRDVQSGFILQYPDSWAKVPSTHEKTRIKVVSAEGMGGEDCGVNVQIEEGIKALTPQESVRLFPDGLAYQQNMRSVIPDLKVESSGRTHISNQDAIFYLSSFTFRSVGLEVPMKMMQVMTARKGKIFTITCRAGATEFESKLPVFLTIYVGFLIKD